MMHGYGGLVAPGTRDLANGAETRHVARRLVFQILADRSASYTAVMAMQKISQSMLKKFVERCHGRCTPAAAGFYLAKLPLDMSPEDRASLPNMDNHDLSSVKTGTELYLLQYHLSVLTPLVSTLVDTSIAVKQRHAADLCAACNAIATDDIMPQLWGIPASVDRFLLQLYVDADRADGALDRVASCFACTGTRHAYGGFINIGVCHPSAAWLGVQNGFILSTVQSLANKYDPQLEGSFKSTSESIRVICESPEGGATMRGYSNSESLSNTTHKSHAQFIPVRTPVRCVHPLSRSYLR